MSAFLSSLASGYFCFLTVDVSLSSSFVGINSPFIEIIAKSQTLVELAHFATDVDIHTTSSVSWSLLSCSVGNQAPSFHLLLKVMKTFT